MTDNGKLHWRVKSARRPSIKLPPHPDACDLEGLRDYAQHCPNPLAVDLFCGAGGLSLGLERAGYDVVLGVDFDLHSVDTHRAHFGGVSLQADLSEEHQIRLIVDSLQGLDISLIAGGPPCQPFSTAGRSKQLSLERNGSRDGQDLRRDLWRSMINIVEEILPERVLIENVPGMTLNGDVFVIAQIVESLERLGYDTDARPIAAKSVGVPQHRERVFIIAARAGLPIEWPQLRRVHTTVDDAISDLPEIVGGEYVDRLPYSGPNTDYQRWARSEVPEQDTDVVFDHFARAVRSDDLEAFKLMNHTTRYSDLPEHLRRYRADIFVDKYKRLPWQDVSRTITAHIAKDGYGYIHPSQHRTISVREAARLQSFPDWFRFSGSQSHAFRMIGNAVPPLLGTALGSVLLNARSGSKQRVYPLPSTCLSTRLADWWQSLSLHEMAQPWRRSSTLWETLLGTLLCEQQPGTGSLAMWRAAKAKWPTPASLLDDKNPEPIVSGCDHSDNLQSLTVLAGRLCSESSDAGLISPFKDGTPVSGVKKALAARGEMAFMEPTTPILRIMERVTGEELRKSRIHSRLMLSRFVGTDRPENAYNAMLEIGDRLCQPRQPVCEYCPLIAMCNYAAQTERVQQKALI